METNIINNQFALQYMFNKKSEFVIENIVSKNAFFYQIHQSETNDNLFFVHAKQITTDTDKVSSINYSGYIIINKGYYNYRQGKRGNLSADDKPIVALLYAISRLKSNKLNANVHIKHTGKCCMCGRRLTDDESIKRGFGNTCWKQYQLYKGI